MTLQKILIRAKLNGTQKILSQIQKGLNLPEFSIKKTFSTEPQKYNNMMFYFWLGYSQIPTKGKLVLSARLIPSMDFPNTLYHDFDYRVTFELGEENLEKYADYFIEKWPRIQKDVQGYFEKVKSKN